MGLGWDAIRVHSDPDFRSWLLCDWERLLRLSMSSPECEGLPACWVSAPRVYPNVILHSMGRTGQRHDRLHPRFLWGGVWATPHTSALCSGLTPGEHLPQALSGFFSFLD